MKRNTLISEEQVGIAVQALAEVAKGGSASGPIKPEARIRAAETLLAHAWIFEPQAEPDTAAATEQA